MSKWLVGLAAFGAIAGCGSSTEGPPELPTFVGGDRPARVYRPADYDHSRAYPLVLLLHGRSVNGALQDFYFGASSLVTEEQFLLVVPDGTPDEDGVRYWNATDACCAPAGVAPPDDVAYLTGLVAEVGESHHVDPRQVFTYGHSNGGFMGFRLACEAPEVFAGIAALAGATFEDFSRCEGALPAVSVLAIHGTADDTVLYDGDDVGGTIVGIYPSAPETVRRHAELAGCDTAMTSAGDALDFDGVIAGDETSVVRYGPGCEPGTGYELWTIDGGTHIPSVNRESTRLVLRWLFSRGR